MISLICILRLTSVADLRRSRFTFSRHFYEKCPTSAMAFFQRVYYQMLQISPNYSP